MPSHALQLRQAKLAFPSVYLLVGVFSDQHMASYGYTSLSPHVERCELVRHCRWVDEVVPEAPWVISNEFLEQRKIQYICVEEGITVDPSCDKARLRGYDEIKSLGTSSMILASDTALTDVQAKLFPHAGLLVSFLQPGLRLVHLRPLFTPTAYPVPCLQHLSTPVLLDFLLDLSSISVSCNSGLLNLVALCPFV